MPTEFNRFNTLLVSVNLIKVIRLQTTVAQVGIEPTDHLILSQAAFPKLRTEPYQ